MKKRSEMLIHPKLWFVHKFDPLEFTEYRGLDRVLPKEIAGEGETAYAVVIPDSVREEDSDNHSGAEIVWFDSREEAFQLPLQPALYLFGRSSDFDDE
jgi:hypothetical protein